jgi:hypothetical protein
MHATIEEWVEAVFSITSALRLYLTRSNGTHRKDLAFAVVRSTVCELVKAL